MRMMSNKQRALWQLRACVAFAWTLHAVAPVKAQVPDRTNYFDDPFAQVTSAIVACPPAAGPGYTEQEVRELAHERSQRGVSCWLDGRCRLHNSYLYDAEIIPRVQKAIRVDGRFANSSLWVLGQRRHVWLKGCANSTEQIAQLIELVQRVDDVERVVNEVMVGSDGVPPYATSQR